VYVSSLFIVDNVDRTKSASAKSVPAFRTAHDELIIQGIFCTRTPKQRNKNVRTPCTA